MYIIDSKSLAKSVDAYCSFFGITKKEFHKESGVSSGTLSQWRTGMYEPDKRSLMKLVQYTGLTVEELMSGNFSGIAPPPENKKTASDGDGLSVEARQIAGNREELKKLIDRLTDQEVSDYLADMRKTILGQ